MKERRRRYPTWLPGDLKSWSHYGSGFSVLSLKCVGGRFEGWLKFMMSEYQKY